MRVVCETATIVVSATVCRNRRLLVPPELTWSNCAANEPSGRSMLKSRAALVASALGAEDELRGSGRGAAR